MLRHVCRLPLAPLYANQHLGLGSQAAEKSIGAALRAQSRLAGAGCAHPWLLNDPTLCFQGVTHCTVAAWQRCGWHIGSGCDP
jgi:hypothetical protein|eukprot:COSAG06_NODE_1808_length_8345_cov_31.960102_3_plen_83_part_00